MKDCSVLIYSCDSYSDVWEAFFKLLFKYWECPYRVYIATETKVCTVPGVTTLNTQGTWTERMYKAVEQIPTKYVIGMCEDMFMRRIVYQHQIEQCIKWMEEDKYIANINFEKEYNFSLPSKHERFGKKPKCGWYCKSCQPTLWRKAVLLDLLDCQKTAWEWELSETPYTYDYYIYTGDIREVVFEYGYKNNQWFGIRKGQWVRESVEKLFKDENIDIDFSIRGFYDGE